jgi:hypothetical protein
MPGRKPQRLVFAGLALLVIAPSHPQSKIAHISSSYFPASESLTYSIEWRLIYAGSARWTLEEKKAGEKPQWYSKLHLESGGLVSKLYKLDETYDLHMQDQFCTTATKLDALEGKRHREVEVTYDYARGKAFHVDRDLVKNSVSRTSEAEIPACITDIIGGLYKLRTLQLEPGQNTQIPLSDGRKTVSARVEAQMREQIKTNAGTFNTIRYEAFVFNGVLFARKAQLQVWLSDDSRRVPVQIRARMGFPVGSITLQLENEAVL